MTTTNNYLGVALWCSCMIHIGRWAFGFHIDLWTTGYDIILGLGRWQPRILRTKGGGA